MRGAIYIKETNNVDYLVSTILHFKINIWRLDMQKPCWSIQTTVSLLSGLSILYGVLLATLWMQDQSHPLAKVGIFIVLDCVLSPLSIPFVLWKEKKGYTLSIIVGLLGLVSFCPYIISTRSGRLIFPVIIIGAVLSVSLIISSVASC